MKNLLEIEIGDVWVEGEISNLRTQASGHCYFTLKDEGAHISCVLFRGNAVRAKAQPENGMQARLFGEVSIYEARGQMQLIVKQLEDAGLGDLQARFEALKRKLNSEGLFDPALKMALPKFPRVIGLVTSPTGAALQDMLNILNRRAPWVQPVLYPVTVQGKGAEHSIAEALYQLSDPSKYNLPHVDVIIVGRGGGSLEDLWNFNEEVVARAIYDCSIPVVSAVGHEIDFTISDFAADVRAPTPSAAAELVAPDAAELKGNVASLAGSLQRVLENRLRHSLTVLTSARRALMPRDAERALREPIQNLDGLRQDLTNSADDQMHSRRDRLREVVSLCAAYHPANVIDQKSERLDQTCSQIERAVQSAQQQALERLRHLQSLMRTLGPEATFARGFSITTNANGDIVKSSADLKKGDVLETRLASGKVVSTVSKTKK